MHVPVLLLLSLTFFKEMLYSILFHFLLAYFGMIQAFEWPTITFKHKNQCNVNQTYDIQMLNCEECTSSNLAVPKDSGKLHSNLDITNLNIVNFAI